jgi:ABC-type branched-subunit amino acid transport system substrate-binding protein
MLKRIRSQLPIGVAALIVVGGLLSACGVSAGTSNLAHSGNAPIKIGLLVPFTGSYGYFGKEFADGAQVAAAEINADGGVLGHKVEITDGDTVSDPIDASAALNKMVSIDHIVALIGPQTPEIGGVQPLIDRYKLPDMFQGGSTAYDRNTDPWIWRASSSDSQLGVAMALYAKQAGYHTAALAFDTEGSAQLLKPVVAKTFQKLGGRIVANVNLTLDQSSYRSEVQRLAAAKPQVIFTSEDLVTAAAFFTDFKQLDNLAIPFIGTDSTTGSDFVKAIGGPATAHRVLVSLVGGSEPGGGGTVYNQWYAKVLGGQPVANSSYAYDSLMDLALAMVKANATTGLKVTKALPEVSNSPGQKVSSWATAVADLKAGKKINYDGASGPMDFNSYQNVFGPFDAIRVTPSGQPVTIHTLTAAELQAATG